MVALKPSRTLTALPVLAIFILQPSTALASGDPLVLFSMLGIALIQALLAGFILLAKSCSGFRMPVMGVYLSVVVVAWLWGLDYLGPGFSEMYARLAIAPLIVFLCLMWLVLSAKKHRGKGDIL